jgi:hypothetical protein
MLASSIASNANGVGTATTATLQHLMFGKYPKLLNLEHVYFR